MNPLTHSPSNIPAVTDTVYDPQSAIKAELGKHRISVLIADCGS